MRVTRPILALIIAFSLLSALACERSSLIKNARRVSSALKDAVPVFTANSIPVVRLNRAIGIADRLIVAFESSNSEDALGLSSALITEFNLLVQKMLSAFKARHGLSC